MTVFIFILFDQNICHVRYASVGNVTFNEMTATVCCHRQYSKVPNTHCHAHFTLGYAMYTFFTFQYAKASQTIEFNGEVLAGRRQRSVTETLCATVIAAPYPRTSFVRICGDYPSGKF